MSTNVGTIDVDMLLKNSAFMKSLNSTLDATEKKAESTFSNVASFAGKAFAIGSLISFGKTSTDVAAQAQSSWTGLKSVTDGMGKSFSEAEGFLTKFTEDGLVPMQNAVTAYKNMLSRGYDTSQIEGILNAFKDASAYGRQSSYTMGEAIQTASEGLKNENSILVDNVGVTKNVAKMWDEYAASIGTTSNNLTMAQKRMAEYNGIMAESVYQMGDANSYAMGFSGRIASLGTAFYGLKVAVGSVVAPIASLFIPAITSAINYVTAFFNKIGQLLSIFGIKFPKIIDKGVNPAVNRFSSGVYSSGNRLKGLGKQAGKTAKEINKAFASVDDLNVLSLPDKDSGSGAGGGSGSGMDGGAGGGVPSGSMSVETPSMDTGAIDEGILAISERIKSFIEPLQSIDFSFLTNAFQGAMDVISPFVQLIGEGLEFAYREVLVPLAKWTIEKALPETIGIFSGSIKILTGIIKALKPYGVWLFENLLLPLSKFTAKVFVTTLKLVSGALNNIGDWINKNDSAVRNITKVIIGFIGAWNGIKLMSFIQQAGGVVPAIVKIVSSTKAWIAAQQLLNAEKLKDKLLTAQIHMLYAKDFVAGLASSASKMVAMIPTYVSLLATKAKDVITTNSMTASQVAHTLAVNGATLATTLLSAAMNALPFMAIIGAVGLVVAGLASWFKSSKENEEQEKKHAEAIQQNIDKIKEKTDAYESFKSSQADKVNGDLAEITLTENLNKELGTLVDANGKVKEGQEARVNYILGELNQAMGTEYSLVEGQISKYDELKKKTEDFINTQRTQIYLEAEKNAVLEAYKNLAQEKADIDEATRIRDEAKNEMDKNNNEESKKRYEEARDQLEKTKNKYGEYHDSIARYEAMSMAAFEKDHEKVKGLYSQKISGLKTYDELSKLSSEDQQKISREQFQNQLLVYETYAKNLKNKIPGYNQEQLDEMKKQVDKARGVYEKVGQATIDGFADKVRDKKGEASEAVGDMADDTIKEAKAVLDVHSPSRVFKEIGGHTVDGFKNGINEKKGSLYESIKGTFSGVVKNVKALFGIHSPSRVFKSLAGYTVEGFKVGIEEESKGMDKVMDKTFSGMIPEEKVLSNLFSVDGMIEGVNKLTDSIIALNEEIAETIELNTLLKSVRNPEIKLANSRNTNNDNGSIKDMIGTLIETMKYNERNVNNTVEIVVKTEDGREIIKKINSAQQEEGRILLEV